MHRMLDAEARTAWPTCRAAAALLLAALLLLVAAAGLLPLVVARLLCLRGGWEEEEQGARQVSQDCVPAIFYVFAGCTDSADTLRTQPRHSASPSSLRSGAPCVVASM